MDKISISSKDNKYLLSLFSYISWSDPGHIIYEYDFNNPYSLSYKNAYTPTNIKTVTLSSLPIKNIFEKYNITSMYFPDLNLTVFSKTNSNPELRLVGSNILEGRFNMVGDINGKLPEDYGGKFMFAECKTETVEEFDYCNMFIERFFDSVQRTR